MEEKYFLSRIQEEDGTFSKGIEVHDTKEAAILSFWGRMKNAYDHPDHPKMTFVSCKIKDSTGAVVEHYNLTWNKIIVEDGEEVKTENKFFLHHIRKEGDTFDKNVDVFDTFDEARRAYATQMEYGYNNSKFPDVSFVCCEISDRNGSALEPFNETWIKEKEGEA